MKTTRIQRKRTRGWRLPDDGVCVTRPGPFGNPFRTADEFRWWLMFDAAGMAVASRAGRELRGRALACWCPVGHACHGDVLVAAAEGRLWDGWHAEGGKLVRVTGSRGAWRAVVYDVPQPTWAGHPHVPLADPVPRRLDAGRSVLGTYPTPERALGAARDFVAMQAERRMCDLRDIDRVRRELCAGA